MKGASVERIYVDKSLYDDFVSRFVEIASNFQLGDPISKTTSLGPVISLASAERIRQQIDDAGEPTPKATRSYLQSRPVLLFCLATPSFQRPNGERLLSHLTSS